MPSTLQCLAVNCVISTGFAFVAPFNIVKQTIMPYYSSKNIYFSKKQCMFLISHVIGPNVGLFLGNHGLSYVSLFVLRLNPIFASLFSNVSCGVDRISALKY